MNIAGARGMTRSRVPLLALMAMAAIGIAGCSGDDGKIRVCRTHRPDRPGRWSRSHGADDPAEHRSRRTGRHRQRQRADRGADQGHRDAGRDDRLGLHSRRDTCPGHRVHVEDLPRWCGDRARAQCLAGDRGEARAAAERQSAAAGMAELRQPHPDCDTGPEAAAVRDPGQFRDRHDRHARGPRRRQVPLHIQGQPFHGDEPDRRRLRAQPHASRGPRGSPFRRCRGARARQSGQGPRAERRRRQRQQARSPRR